MNIQKFVYVLIYKFGFNSRNKSNIPKKLLHFASLRQTNQTIPSLRKIPYQLNSFFFVKVRQTPVSTFYFVITSFAFIVLFYFIITSSPFIGSTLEKICFLSMYTYIYWKVTSFYYIETNQNILKKLLHIASMQFIQFILLQATKVASLRATNQTIKQFFC